MIISDNQTTVSFNDVEAAKAHVKSLGDNLLMFVGFSGAGYKDTNAICDLVRAELQAFDPVEWIIGAGKPMFYCLHLDCSNCCFGILQVDQLPVLV